MTSRLVSKSPWPKVQDLVRAVVIVAVHSAFFHLAGIGHRQTRLSRLSASMIWLSVTFERLLFGDCPWLRLHDLHHSMASFMGSAGRTQRLAVR